MPKPRSTARDRGVISPAIKQLRQDAQAAQAWVHPADAMEHPEDAPPSELATDQAALLRTLIELIVPPMHYGRVRRWEAGHHRLVVMVYMLAPEYFPGWTRDDLAQALGLSRRPLDEHFAAVKRALLTRQTPPAP